RGELIGRVDSVDVWLTWKIAAQARFLRAQPEVGMVWTDMMAIDSDGVLVHPAYLRERYSAYRRTRLNLWLRPAGTLRELGESIPSELSARSAWAGDLFSAMFFGNLVHTSTVLLRRDRLHSVGGFNETFRPAGEDYDFHWRTCREGPVGFLDAATIQYRVAAEDQLSGPTYRVPIALN